jgi:hypothetical protein
VEERLYREHYNHVPKKSSAFYIVSFSYQKGCNMKDSIVFYKSFYECLKEFPNELQAEVYKAIFEKYFYDNEIELTGQAKGIFSLIKPNIDSANKRYFANLENGKKGGAPKGNSNAKKTTQKQPKNNPIDNLKTSKNNLNDNVNDNVNDNDNVKVKHKYGEYKHVLLTNNELEKLKQDYSNYLDLIKYLDEYIEMKGYKAKNHYLAIKKWVINAVNEKNEKEPEGKVEWLSEGSFRL